jgi:hypothetical protein
MRATMLVFWLLLPLLVGAYHFGPGQEHLKLDAAAQLVSAAEQSVSAEDWTTATQRYADAIAALPENQPQAAYRLRLEMAKSQMNSGQLPEARVALDALLGELEKDPATAPQLLDETRSALANSQYFMTWLMRLEGKSAEEWEPEVEAARQHYRLLAENAPTAAHRLDRTHDLEATVRLARMELADLQGLPIPKQCSGCCSGQCKKPGNKPAKKKSDKKGANAGMGPLPDGSGA